MLHKEPDSQILGVVCSLDGVYCCRKVLMSCGRDHQRDAVGEIHMKLCQWGNNVSVGQHRKQAVREKEGAHVSF